MLIEAHRRDLVGLHLRCVEPQHVGALGGGTHPSLGDDLKDPGLVEARDVAVD